MARRHGWIPLQRKLDEGRRIIELQETKGWSLAEAGRWLNLSETTAWRRAWFVRDWENGGKQARRIPKQRGTRARPSANPRPRKPAAALAPRKTKWLDVYTIWCSPCCQRYSAARPCCPLCGRSPSPG